MTKVINLFGAPGSGKSTTAAGLFYHLKIKGYSVHTADEWIKDKVFENATYPFKDQLYTFAKQNKKIRQMNGKVDYIICDSPLLLSIMYGVNEPECFKRLVVEYFNKYDNINFFLTRDHNYEKMGRIHTEEQSEELSQRLLNILEEYEVEYTKLTASESLDKILQIFKEIE